MILNSFISIGRKEVLKARQIIKNNRCDYNCIECLFGENNSKGVELCTIISFDNLIDVCVAFLNSCERLSNFEELSREE